MRKFVYIIVYCFMLLTGCTTHRVATSSERVRTEYVHQTDTFLRHDSTYVHDSVFVALRGDTILQFKWRTEYRDRIVYRNHTDTLNLSDTIIKVVTVTKEVNRPTLYQRITSTCGILCLIGIAIVAVLYYLRRHL